MKRPKRGRELPLRCLVVLTGSAATVDTVVVVLAIDRRTWLSILAEAWRVYPEEACGVLIGRPGPGQPIVRFEAIPNAAASSRVFTLDPRGFMQAERRADDEGLEVVGVVHSHTHTAAYPSPTDVAEATKPLVPPTWHWAIVSLAWGFPELRSFRVEPGEGDVATLAGIAEERVVLSEVSFPTM